jgi:hypothetical protein
MRGVLPRNTIIEAVWGLRESVENNTVDAFVQLLRDKIDAGHRGSSFTQHADLDTFCARPWSHENTFCSTAAFTGNELQRL